MSPGAAPEGPDGAIVAIAAQNARFQRREGGAY